MATLLLIEDNPHIMKINADTLKEAGYTIIQANTLRAAEEFLKSYSIDLIVLDIMMPDGNGVVFCQNLRQYSSIPVLFLSAKNQDVDIVEGLQKGADDYLAKPYNLKVLVARIEALLRRTGNSDKKTFLEFGALRLDPFAMRAYINEEDLLLTQKEFAIVMLLAQHVGKIVEKNIIYFNVWNQPLSEDNRAFWTTMSRLKKKLDRYSQYVNLVSARTNGYKLEINIK